MAFVAAAFPLGPLCRVPRKSFVHTKRQRTVIILLHCCPQ